MDKFHVGTGELSGTADRGDGGSQDGPPEVPLVAVLAAVLASLEQEPAGTRAGPGGMPVWKRAGLAELMNAGAGIRGFI